MKKFLTSFWFWGIMLVAFVTIILWDDDFEENAKGTYVKHKMTLQNVNFSQIENGFEHARMYAVECEMDDSQTNMDGTDIKMLFFKPDCATFTGHLIAASATKNPFEAKFSGDIRMWDTDNERMRTEEMRYLFNRKELTTQRPVTFWKDNAILTGLGMTYNTETQEAVINQQVVIRLWEEKKPASATAQMKSDKDPVSGLPIAEAPIEEIIKSQPKHAATDSAIVKEKAEAASISSDTSEIKVTEKSKEDKVIQTTAVTPIKETATSTQTLSDNSQAQASSTRPLRELQRPEHWQRMTNRDQQRSERMSPPQPRDGQNTRERKRPGMLFPRQNGENGNPANLFQQRERPSREEMEKRRAEREKMRRERMERSRNSRIGSAPARINSEKANTSQ